ncbi:MAG: NAD(P)-binding domain-containing protein [Bacteroidota bacterium]
MKLTFIGIGNVGYSIANHLGRLGHRIIIGHEDAANETVREALRKNPDFRYATLQDAVDEAEVVFLATPFGANESILNPLRFTNRILIDCTNPVGPGMTHGLQSRSSGAERVAEWAGDARVVKSFSVYGFENFRYGVADKYTSRPIMPIASDHIEAKEAVSPLIREMGFDILDTGVLSSALHLEHMTLLWVKMVRTGGAPNFTWGYQKLPIP